MVTDNSVTTATNSTLLEALITQIKQCTLCAGNLPFSPKPVFTVNKEARILIIGQAPGIKAHTTETPWNDPSGDELRRWLGVNKEQFYNPALFALMPMGFCYPGKGKGGDLPPRPECAPLWHQQLRLYMPHIQLTLLAGSYAVSYYVPGINGTLAEKIRASFSDTSRILPLVHPSPRNKKWQQLNPWFKEELVPVLQKRVTGILNTTVT